MSGPFCALLGELAGIYLLGNIKWDQIPILAAVIAVSAMMIFFLCTRKRGLLIFCLFAVLGSVLFFQHTEDCARELFEYQEHYVQVTGRVAEVPYQRDGRWYYVIAAERLLYGEKEVETKERIRVSSSEQFAWNDIVKAEGFLEGFEDRMNPSSFDSAAYYHVRGIHYRLYAQKLSLAGARAGKYSFRDGFISLQATLCKWTDRNYTEPVAGILKTVITGDFRHMDQELSDKMIRAGVRRYLYSPHIHMLLLLGVFAVLRKKLSRNTSSLILGIIMILYASVQSAKPIFFRSFLFAGIGMLISRFAGVRNQMDNWGITVLSCGLVNPVLYIDSGFILSALGHFYFLLFYDSMEHGIKGKLLNRGIRPSAHKGVMYGIRTLAASLIFTAGLLPAAAYYFNGYSFLGTVLGIIYIPLVLLLNLLLPVTAALSYCFAEPVLLEQSIENIAALLIRLANGIYLPLAKPSLLHLGVYYTAIATVYFTVKKRKIAYKAAAVSLGMAAVLGSSGLFSRDMKITFVNVGQGDAAVVMMPDDTRILIDAGGTLPFSDYNYGEAELLPYLQDAGIWEIDYALVSHYHEDHAKGMTEVLNNMQVRELLLPACTPGDPVRRELEEAAARNHTKITYVREGSRYDFQNNSGMEIICPPEGIRNQEDQNEACLVVRVWYGEFSGLFTGDITAENELKLLKQEGIRDCDVLKVPHHGSATSSSEAFIKAVRPRLSYIGVGEDNVYQLPNPEVVRRYQEQGSRILRADENGTVTVRGGPKGIKSVQTYR